MMSGATISNGQTKGICPLCDAGEFHRSLFRGVEYLNRVFRYVRCTNCGTHYCHPMPDEAVLSVMYGPEYKDAFPNDGLVADSKQPDRVCDWLERLPPGTFVDYGCGAGGLLTKAVERGWNAVGVEYDEEVARATALATSAKVVTVAQSDSLTGIADLLYLGDVLEHLTQMNEQFPRVLSLLKPGGTLLAQGPLEG